MPLVPSQSPSIQSPFLLENDMLYQEWRDRKLEGYPTTLGEIVVEIKDPRALTANEHEALLKSCRRANMVVYAGGTGDDPDRNIPHAIARQMGVFQLNHNWLADDDGLTSLTVRDEGIRQNFIPYSNRLIKWHTDGYYNTAAEQIQTLNLHCVSPAATGGNNRLMDHEIAYILLRDKNPDYIRSLMEPDVMTIPARIDEDGKIGRHEEPGPVFSIHSRTGNLHMRYTIREHNVVWKDDEVTREALAFLETILKSSSPYIYQGRLESGMGLVSTNVLHDRSDFNDDELHKRLIYRARYFDRLAGTNLQDIYASLFN